MTDRNDLSRRMRETLAKTFPRRQDAELIAGDAGLDMSRVDWSGSAQAFWRLILEDADRFGRVDALLERASRDAPAVVELAVLRQEHGAWTPSVPSLPVRPPVTSVPTSKSRRPWPMIGGGLALLVVIAAVYTIVSGSNAKPTPTLTKTNLAAAMTTMSPNLPSTTTPEVSTTSELVTTASATGGAAASGPGDLDLIWIPAGDFTMGSTESDPQAYLPEMPQHKISLAGFWIMRTEVTNAQYLRCVDAGACTASANKDYALPEYASYPVTDVDWYQANDYAHWVGGRLPTEAEWEKACRGTDARIYPWGDRSPTDEYARYFGANATQSATIVGSYPKGKSPYGLLDMAGNVREWTSSLWGEDRQTPSFGYPYSTTDGREDQSAPRAILRVMRGGYFRDGEGYLRCPARREGLVNEHDWGTGFRVAVSS